MRSETFLDIQRHRDDYLILVDGVQPEYVRWVDVAAGQVGVLVPDELDTVEDADTGLIRMVAKSFRKGRDGCYAVRVVKGRVHVWRRDNGEERAATVRGG